jgi:hypothetical protein
MAELPPEALTIAKKIAKLGFPQYGDCLAIMMMIEIHGMTHDQRMLHGSY